MYNTFYTVCVCMCVRGLFCRHAARWIFERKSPDVLESWELWVHWVLPSIQFRLTRPHQVAVPQHPLRR